MMYKLKENAKKSEISIKLAELEHFGAVGGIHFSSRRTIPYRKLLNTECLILT